ncbi:MAG: zinc-ribbon domain-containing protein, partial [Oscillochloris sp.]|nr:zinc-ribbon domain-containing protein [Oscillochloris sp.]
MRCTNCDAELAPNARFCTSCGTPVVTSPSAATGSESQTMADVYDNHPGERIDLPDPTIVGSGQGSSGLKYKIIGTTMQAVVIELPPNQTVFSERGGMSWMSANINMQTNMEGGLGGAFKRMFSGESIFMVSFTSQ